MLLYVDTNVYLDYLLERENRAGNDVSEIAFQLFKRAADCEFRIVLSDAVLEELYRYVPSREAHLLLTFIERKISVICATPEDRILARTLPTHGSDALHIALARRAGADLIVTRNVTDFRHLIKTKRPEEL